MRSVAPSALCRTFGPVAGTFAPACILLPLRGVILCHAEFDKPALCVGKVFAVGERYVQLGVLAVEVVLEALEVSGALPLAHWQVVEQVVAAGLGLGGRHLGLCQYPLQALDGEPAHVRLSSGKLLNFYQLIPLYPEELKFKMENNSEVLLDKLDEIGIQYRVVDVNRKGIGRE